MKSLSAMLNRYQGAGPLVLRIALGVIFTYHGIDKFRVGLDMVEGAFDGWGVPAPAISAAAVAVIEIAAGLALIAGVATRLAAGLLALVILGAIAFVKADLGLISDVAMPGLELDLALLAGLVSVTLTGPGWLGADAALGTEAPAPEPVARPSMA